jgi:rhodanese-related sulfurtransferase
MELLLREKEICSNQGIPMPNIIIIDCRFPYEFQGGHIDGAVNVSSQEQMQELLFGSKDKI